MPPTTGLLAGDEHGHFTQVRVTFRPSDHFSGRNLRRQNSTNPVSAHPQQRDMRGHVRVASGGCGGMGIATHLAFMAALPSSACRVSTDLSWLRCSSASLCSCCTSSSIRNGYPCEGKGGTPLARPASRRYLSAALSGERRAGGKVNARRPASPCGRSASPPTSISSSPSPRPRPRPAASAAPTCPRPGRPGP